MDAQLNQTVTQIMSQNGVVGVICTDKNGLSLASKGKVTTDMAGFVYGISSRAKQLGSDDPVILIETDSSNILIRNQDDMTIALFRAP
eukprot:TRINITY_DN9813_c0_g2_i1.p1 TRINITY_DN9813_c0_g2~~TRINITY_DN9813_c0_g2_i1.p1  ORF type:complete len:100 (-),score=8.79 TRINITY_DN9813_c0_g2_i1:308-571(-)